MTFVEEHKFCPKCERWHPESLFARDKKRTDGRFPYCKICFRKTRLKAGDTKSVREK